MTEWKQVPATAAGGSHARMADWLERVVAQNYRLLFSVAYCVLRDASGAEDAAQQAVLHALEKLPSLRDTESVVGWLTSITRNVARDMLKKGGGSRPRPLSDTAVRQVAAPAERRLDTEKRLLRDEIGRLPERQAVVLTLRFLEDLPIEVVAVRLGITANAAAVRLHRALESLRRSPAVRKIAERGP